jgi:hypothetical protein
MKVIEEWVNFNPFYPGLAILIALFEPLKCLILITERVINKRKAISVNTYPPTPVPGRRLELIMRTCGSGP